MRAPNTTADPRVASIEALYAECESDVLSLSPDDYEVTLALDADGVLESCYTVMRGCADDCSVGIKLADITFGTCQRP